MPAPNASRKRKLDRRAPFVRRSGLLTILCTAAWYLASATVFALLGPESPRRDSPRTLTFEQRVSFQRKIEEVYWRHRTAVPGGARAHSSLDQAMPRAQLEKKVAQYLQYSEALQQYWHRPITAEQLQAEINRIATQTRQPDVLRELFEALGNDPSVIAECLVRPQIAEREVRAYYAFDRRIHAQLREGAAVELAAHPRVEQMKLTSGRYSETEFVKAEQSPQQAEDLTGDAIKLNGQRWNETVKKLAAMLETSPAIRPDGGEAAAEKPDLPIGKLSPVQEDEASYYATAVIGTATDRLKVATLTWPKQPLESWREGLKPQLSGKVEAPVAAYTLPTITGQTSGCTGDTWAPSSLNAPTQRTSPTVVWTGSEAIFWGGYDGNPPTFTNSGGRYNPSTDGWTTVTTVNAPSPRAFHTAIWTGSEMIIWGGVGQNTGGRYEPSTDTWVATSTTDAPTGRSRHSGVWTGSEMIVWGGIGNAGLLNSGARYSPQTDSWTPVTTTNAPLARDWHSTVWTGKEMVVWGGTTNGNPSTIYLNTGGRYNPTSDSWTTTDTTGAPVGRYRHTAVWTGTKMIVWGGAAPVPGYNTGGQYDPEADTWTATDTANAPGARYAHTAIWTGKEMVVWGGFAGGIANTGGRYDPNTNSWVPTTTANAPPQRWDHAAVWTGDEMIVWGGNNGDRSLTTRGRYNPTTDTWVGPQPPGVRSQATAIWTGSEMIVWGGSYGGSDFKTGAKYNPATDSWAPTSLVSAPVGSFYHTAIWTGSEMIVWGGLGNTGFSPGGRYNPGTDSWAPVSTVGAPSGRSYHTAIWSGTQMIVWGGHDMGGTTFSNGGKYDPSTDQWTPTSATDAPTARSYHTALWTGSEMIVWGGSSDAGQTQYLNTGGRYNPVTDSWKSLSTSNAPAPRSVHTAVWTGSTMLVWGGVNTNNGATFFNSGGRYDPNTDNWTAISQTDAPEARGGHSAIWTGQEMIVWGGGSNDFPYYFNTGGRYNPGNDTWTATSTIKNAPIGHAGHTAVWTGSEMIVWGGTSQWGHMDNGGKYCGEQPPPPPPITLGNISTRMEVGTSENVLIAGFIIDGSVSKTLLIRAAGPSLFSAGIPNPLSDPRLELHDPTRAIAINDNWQTTQLGGAIQSYQADAIMSGGLAPNDPKEPAMIVTLPPGSYTAIVSGVNNAVGVGTVEVYDMSSSGAARLVNISSRGRVATDGNVLIAGVIVVNQPSRVLIRSTGPSLAAAGVSNVLADPELELHDATSLIATNDDWQSTQIGGVITGDQASDILGSSLAPNNAKEAAMIVTLSPGSYTAIVRGADRTEGVGTIEVYLLP